MSMENSRVSDAIVLMVVFACCVIRVVPGLAQPADDERGLYVGTMVGVTFRQDLHHKTAFTTPDNIEMTVSSHLVIDYGIGFAAIGGKGISDYTALEFTGSWASLPSHLDVPLPLPTFFAEGLSQSGFELPSGFNYDGKLVTLQSKIDLLLFPMKRAMSPSDGAKPYLGGGVGIVRSNMDMDIEKEGAQAVVETLESFAELVPENLAGLIPENFAGLIPEKIDEKETDFQLSLRAGVNMPFNGIDLDLGWQFYRTYVTGEDNSSHVAAGILKYVF